MRNCWCGEALHLYFLCTVLYPAAFVTVCLSMFVFIKEITIKASIASILFLLAAKNKSDYSGKAEVGTEQL